MQLIDEYENINRGLYSGSVGYILPNGNFDFNVVIRSIQYNEATRYLSIMVGSAITDMCNAEEEYNECLLKAQAMINTLNAEIVC
jgi:para-aminobenzoate synthetase component 1